MKLYYEKMSSASHGVRRNLLQKVVDASGVIHTYQYFDGFAQLEAIVLPNGQRVSFSYTVSVFPFPMESVMDYGERLTTFEYDSTRKMTTMTSPLGCITKYGYSLAGSPVTLLHWIEDPRGYRTVYMYDSSRRVVSMGAGDAVWTWTYSTGPSKTVMTAPSGALTTYVFDSIGNLASQIQASGTPVSLAYTERLPTSKRYPLGPLLASLTTPRSGE